MTKTKPQEADQMTLSKDVWETLSKIDVTDHVELKGKLTYLSWAWAYGIMMKHYPDLHYSFEEDRCEETSTVEISCTVHIHTGSDRDQVMMRHMWLPCMDHKNAAMVNPDKWAINKCKMRCLVKCFAMFGLGHYIYAGEDLPEEPAELPRISGMQLSVIEAYLISTGVSEERFCQKYAVNKVEELKALQYDRAVAALEAKSKAKNAVMSDDNLAKIGLEIAGK